MGFHLIRTPPPSPVLRCASLSFLLGRTSTSLHSPSNPTFSIANRYHPFHHRRRQEMKHQRDKALTKKELEVVQILCKFPKLVLEAESRRIPDFLRWGSRRRRSVLDDDSSLLEPPLLPLPPPPPPLPPLPSISPPLHSIPPHSDVNEERKDVDRDGGGATLSPATSLSFPASGREEPDGQPTRPPFSPPIKVYKRRSKGVQEEERRRQGQQHQQDASSHLAPLGPTTLQSRQNRWWEIQQLSVDRIVGEETPSPSMVTAGRRTEKMPAFDLSTTLVEEEEEQQSSACKAAM